MSDLGYLSKSEANLATTVANSATFQTAVGAANATEALAKIYRNGTDEKESDFDRPRALIADPQDGTVTKQSSSGWVAEGTLQLCFELLVPSEYADDNGNLDIANFEASNLWFKNTIGQIIDEMRALVDVRTLDGVLAITKFDSQWRVLVTQKEDNKPDFYSACFVVSWRGPP